MKISVISAGLLSGCAAVGLAAPVNIVLDTEFSGADDPFGTIELLFEQDGANSVKLTVTHDLSSAGGTQFISRLLLNLDPDEAPHPDPDVVIDNNNGANGITTTSTLKEDNPDGDAFFKADGDGFFDIRFDWGSGDFTESVTSAVFFFDETGITPEWFAFESEDGGGNGNWYAAAHVQGVPADPEDDDDPGDGSGWIGGVIVEIPLPGSAFLAFGGLGALGLSRRRSLD